MALVGELEICAGMRVPKRAALKTDVSASSAEGCPFHRCSILFIVAEALDAKLRTYGTLEVDRERSMGNRRLHVEF